MERGGKRWINVERDVESGVENSRDVEGGGERWRERGRE